MIQAPLEISVITTGPTSAIAPNLLAGTSSFPTLLQASQTGIGGLVEAEVQESESFIDAEPKGFEQDINLTSLAGLITQLPAQMSVDLPSGRSMPPIGNLPPPAGSEPPKVAPNIPLSTPAEAIAGKRAPPRPSVNQNPHSPLANGSRLVPGQGDEVIETDVIHLPKNARSSDQLKAPDGPGVSPQENATLLTTSGARSVQHTLANSAIVQPSSASNAGSGPSEIATGAIASRENQSRQSAAPISVRASAMEHDLVQNLERRPVIAAAVLQSLSRSGHGAKIESTFRAVLGVDPELRPSERRLTTQVQGRAILPASLANANTAEAANLPLAANPLGAQSNVQLNAQPVAGLSATTGLSAIPTGIEPRSEARAGQPIETVIGQLAEVREFVRASRPELTLRHHEFGAINVRIEATGADLRATLASRDPGFVPAVNAALAERAIAASAESTSGQSSRSNEQNGNQSSASQTASQGGFSGSGASSDGRYGSSTGSGQGSSQPYWEQSGGDEEDSVVKDRSVSADVGSDDAHGTGLFA